MIYSRSILILVGIMKQILADIGYEHGPKEPVSLWNPISTTSGADNPTVTTSCSYSSGETIVAPEDSSHEKEHNEKARKRPANFSEIAQKTVERHKYLVKEFAKR